MLFDRVWTESLSVGKVPQLIRKFGADATAALLSSGRIRLLCHEVLVTQVGQTPGVSWLPGVLPLGSYAFATAKIDRRPQIDKYMQAIDDLSGPPAKQSKQLRSLVGERITEPGPVAGTVALDQLKLDCQVGNPVLNVAVASAAESAPTDYQAGRIWAADPFSRVDEALTRAGPIPGGPAKRGREGCLGR